MKILIPVLLLVLAGAAQAADRIERGRYLVATSGCTDCHTPMKMGAHGPEPDQARRLSGHPQAFVVSAPAALPPGPWMVAIAATGTAYAGPWGLSFAANLTPDDETGLGRWSEADFLQTIRTGRHLGRGRPVLPPMPIPVYSQMTDDDLKAVFAYLKSLPPIRNQVPEPVAPAQR
ncbi:MULTISPECIES: c-type cytochrome [unclassified Roseateles]|uniref:c-type cytochrome n=1 Tax=unclassified Roseateles TaxID=2626991 RepID=UPI0006FA6E54|nr:MULTISPECIES: c-type cytochrome [unclassified Roseateles]KQW42763.1 diheme cytochrome c-553 [Pelomonas sp. Root405]KRA69440.1 diheme cytochrome c-553 [Pelomonas sp. Root662]